MIKINFFISHCKWFLIFSLFISIPALYSQSYQVRSYTEDDGLANSIVFDIIQDKSGCMWFATRTGISIYDGSRWETHSNTKGLPVAVYSRIRCDSQGTIWALAAYPDLGIAYYQEDGERWLVPPRPLPSNQGKIVTSFEVAVINKQTVVAVGTKGKGLFLWSKNKWKNFKHFRHRVGLISDTINDIAADNEKFYIAAANGLYVLKDDNIDSTINEQIASPSLEVIGIAIEKSDNSINAPGESTVIWLLGKDWIGCLEKGGFRIVSPSITIPRDDVNVFVQPDNQGGLFYGNRYGIFHIDKDSGGIRHFDKEHGLVTGGAVSAYLDREKNIWFGTYRGVSKIASMRFANYRQLHGLLSDETTAVREIKPGHMVFGHNDGLTFFADNQFEHLVFSREEYKDETFSRVLDIREDQEGNLWAAAADLGLAKIFNKKVIRWYGPTEGLIGQVSSVLVDQSGKIWAGTYEGLFTLQGNRFIEIEPAQDAKGIPVRRLFPGTGNSIYVATTHEGIYLFKNNEWTNVSHPTDRDANRIFAVLADSRGKVWVGSKGGLYIINNHTLDKFKKKDFSIDRSVYFIVEDQQNRLWFGTDNGVIKWDGRVQKEYTVQQGLVGRETNRAAGLVDHQGRVWIGTDRGLSCYREEFEKRDVPPPIVELISLDVAGEQMSLDVINKFKYTMNNLVFTFRVISFIDEKGIRLQTKLEGFDPDWVVENVSNTRQVRYTNLSPGHYKFHLKARNSEGMWSRVVSSEDIIILKPFWQERWFYIIVILILGFGFISIQRYLSKKRYASLLEKQVLEKTVELQKSQNDLEKRVEERTTELARANKELQEEQNRLRTIFAVTPDMLVLMDRDFVYRAVNRAFCQFMGKKEKELIGKTDFEVFPPDKAKIYRQSDIDVMKGGKLHIQDRQAPNAEGIKKWLQVAKAPIFDNAGEPIGLLVSVRDITRRKKMEEQIKASLREKEVLLKEIHHRVKNNLQIIVSLLNLQSGYINDTHALDVFKNSQERIRAMALVHEKLYESEDLARIDFQEYIQSLVSHLFGSYSLAPDQVHLKLEIADVAFDIETAIPLGLIINELISNSIKHAFPDRRQGELQIILEGNKAREEEYEHTLIIKDNGVGFPEDSEIGESNTLGMLLVNSLAKQLHGSIELDRRDGTTFTLKFKKSSGKGKGQ